MSVSCSVFRVACFVLYCPKLTRIAQIEGRAAVDMAFLGAWERRQTVMSGFSVGVEPKVLLSRQAAQIWLGPSPSVFGAVSPLARHDDPQGAV